MSREAMEAVQLHSRYQSPEDYYPFRVLLAVASFAGTDGTAGVEGNYQQCPSQQAIADRARIHRNSVSKYLDLLIRDGELSVSASGGSGRGSWTVYQIELPIESGRVQMAEEIAQDSNGNGAITLVQIAEEIAHMRELIAQGNCTNCTRHQSDDVQDTLEKPDTSPPTPPSEDGRIAIADLAEYFCQIAGKKLPRKPKSSYAVDLWWDPLEVILASHNFDLRETKRAMYGAKQYADDAGLTIATPKSLINLATAGSKDKTGYRDTNGVMVVSRR